MMKYGGEPKAIWNWIHLISGREKFTTIKQIESWFDPCVGWRWSLVLAVPSKKVHEMII